MSSSSDSDNPVRRFGMSHRFPRLQAFIKALTMSALILFQAACLDEKEQARQHHENGLQLLQDGEPEKASLEFRNALKADENAVAPRLEYAKLLLTQNKLQEAIGNFLKVIELEPENYNANLSLGQILLIASQIEDATSYIETAIRLRPEDPQSLALKSMLDFRTGDFQAAELAASKALLAAPGQTSATLVMAEILLGKGEFAPAIALLDEGIQVKPNDLGLHLSKLVAIEESGTMQEIGDQLKAMHNVFPEDPDITRNLVRWHLDQGNTSAADNLLRGQVDRFPENLDHLYELADYLISTKGMDAAIAEISNRIEDSNNDVELISFLAGLEFTNGQAAVAIPRLEGLLNTDLSQAHEDKIAIQLANILFETGNSERSSELAANILSRNPKDADGLKLRALLYLEDSNPDSAIADLRVALDAAPEDTTILTLLAIAHERNGSIGLAQNRLGLAVQNSGSGVSESLAYAKFLVRDGKQDVAVSVLANALDLNGEVPELLNGLARLHLALGNWDEAQELARRLSNADIAGNYTAQVNAIKVAGLNGQERFDASVGLLSANWQSGDQSGFVLDNMVRALILGGSPDQAQDLLNEALENDPANARAHLLQASVHLYNEQTEKAEAIYVRVMQDHPELELGYLAASGFYSTHGEPEKAAAVEQAGLKKARTVEQLLFLHADRKEKAGDFEAAIAAYERLFEIDQLSDLTANNLASNLAEHRDDTESLNRAANISKRFRSSDVPEFLDTYGWSLYRLGDYEKALVPLQTAANQLPENLLVQMHYGFVLARLMQTELAIEKLNAVQAASKGRLDAKHIAAIEIELSGLRQKLSEKEG